MVNNRFVMLCSKAWAIQALAYLYEGYPARISPMAHHLSAGRTSITTALQHLVELGYLKKNRGHGHPLRPAYELTSKGRKVGEWAAGLDKLLAADDWKVVRKTWALPVMRQAIPARRFGQLRAELKPVTDRALSGTLKTLEGYDWLDRQVDSSASPPSVTYTPGAAGRILIPSLEESYRL